MEIDHQTDRGCVHVEFDAPEGIVAFAVVAWTDEPVLISPRNLESPDGRTLIDDRGHGPIRTYDEPFERTILVPNSDDPEAAAAPGRWSVAPALARSCQPAARTEPEALRA